MRRFLLLTLFAAAAAAPAGALSNADALRLFDRLARKLELTAPQRSEIFFLALRNRDEIRDRLAAEEDARIELRRAIAQPAFDADRVRDRACRLADAELATSLLAARLYAEVWAKLDPSQRARVCAEVEGPPPRDALLSAAEEFAGARDLYLTIGK